MSESNVHESVKQFRNVYISNSTVEKLSSLGDDTSLTEAYVGERCFINRRNVIFKSRIGAFTHTGQNTNITYATVGKFCSISWNVCIGGINHDYNNISTMIPVRWKQKLELDCEITDPNNCSGCVIGNDVWIGSGANILGGVKIGDGAVIGANAVVTHDVEPYAIVVGCPAKTIKYRFDDDTINALLEIRWWDWQTQTLKENVALLQEPPSSEVLIKMKKISIDI